MQCGIDGISDAVDPVTHFLGVSSLDSGRGFPRPLFLPEFPILASRAKLVRRRRASVRAACGGSRSPGCDGAAASASAGGRRFRGRRTQAGASPRSGQQEPAGVFSCRSLPQARRFNKLAVSNGWDASPYGTTAVAGNVSGPDGRRNAGTARLLREGDADARQDADQLVHMTGKLPDIGFPRDRPLFHVEGAVDLDLERLDA